MGPNQFVDAALAELRRSGFSRRGWAGLLRALTSRARDNTAARPDLVREVRLGEAAGAVLAVAVGVAFWRLDGAPVVTAVAPGLLAWLVLAEWVRVELGLVRHPLTGDPGPAVGAANWMTLFRGWAAVPAGLAATWSPRPTAAWAALCIAAGVTDLVDGSVARLQRNESRLGRLLDPVLDAFFFTAAAAALARWGAVPWWIPVLIGVRYFTPVVGGLALMFARGSTLPVRHTPWGQRSTLAIGVALLAAWGSFYLHPPPWVVPALYAVAIASMALALAGILRRAPVSSA